MENNACGSPAAPAARRGKLSMRKRPRPEPAAAAASPVAPKEPARTIFEVPASARAEPTGLAAVPSAFPPPPEAAGDARGDWQPLRPVQLRPFPGAPADGDECRGCAVCSPPLSLSGSSQDVPRSSSMVW